MTSTEDLTIIGGITNIILILIVLIWLATVILSIVGYWFMFKKADEKGWKAFIPFYSTYIMTKLTWDKKYFWIMIGITFIQIIITIILFIVGSVAAASINASASLYNNASIPVNTAIEIPIVTIFILFSLSMIVGYIFNVISNFRISRAFGHDVWFTVGILFLPYVFLPIIGFGKSPYLGNMYKKDKEFLKEQVSLANKK